MRESTSDLGVPAPRIARATDALLFSGAWVALAAAALTAASFHALGAALRPPAVALAFFGTLAVYAIDRVRDLERDRATAPLRSAFVARHRTALTAIASGAAVASAACAALAGPGALAIAAAVLLVGLFHRRLKRWSPLQPLYVVLAWLAVVVGIPAATATRATNVGWAIALLAPALFANVAAPRSLAVARAVAGFGIGVAWAAPPVVRSLGAVAVATAAALLAFRPTERYGLGVLDGALIAGGAIALFAR